MKQKRNIQRKYLWKKDTYNASTFGKKKRYNASTLEKKPNQLLSFGALHKQTRQYVYPKIAIKTEPYVCPECDKDLILCQGNIRVHHFRHKVDHVNPCHHYDHDHPSEAQIHKEAKLVLKTMLEQHIPLSFSRACIQCKVAEEHEIPSVTETSTVVLEHRFTHNGNLAIADVAYLDSDSFCCLFEICNTHKTKEGDRPEPWFEIDAQTMIQKANATNDGTVVLIPCIRETRCDKCLIALRNAELASINMDKLKKTNLEKYVRIKLGQKTFPGDVDYPDPSQPRPEHLRLHFHADCSENIENNKRIMELFNNDFIEKKVVVHSWKGLLTTYVVSSALLYNRYDYWNSIMTIRDPDDMPYPCEKATDEIGEKTVTIIANLILYCQEAHEIKQNKIKKLKQAISKGIERQKMGQHSDNIQAQMTNIRSSRLYSNAVKALNQELALVENDIRFWMVKTTRGIDVDERRISAVESGSKEITIRHPISGNKMRRNLFTNETNVHGKPLRQNITIKQIIEWYNSLDDNLIDE